MQEMVVVVKAQDTMPLWSLLRQAPLPRLLDLEMDPK